MEANLAHSCKKVKIEKILNLSDEVIIKLYLSDKAQFGFTFSKMSCLCVVGNNQGVYPGDKYPVFVYLTGSKDENEE